MKSKYLPAFLLVFTIAGCETKPSYEEVFSQKPLPNSTEQLENECSWIRSEIARMHSVSAAAVSSQYALMFQAKARNNIAVLESRAATIGCRAAFSSQSNQSVAGESSKIQQCINACKQNTDRSAEICFDQCNK